MANLEESLFTGCDVCGNNHDTAECPELGETQQPTNTIFNTKARLTIPPYCSLLVNDGVFGIGSQTLISAKTKLGPYEAPRTLEQKDYGTFPLKIFSSDGSVSVFLDTTNENECNWLCLVRRADTPGSANCMALQLGNDIIYMTTRDIEVNEEIKVTYAPHYAKKMGYGPASDLLQTQPATAELYKCQLCGLGFSSLDQLEIHKSEGHTVKKELHAEIVLAVEPGDPSFVTEAVSDQAVYDAIHDSNQSDIPAAHLQLARSLQPGQQEAVLQLLDAHGELQEVHLGADEATQLARVLDAGDDVTPVCPTAVHSTAQRPVTTTRRGYSDVTIFHRCITWCRRRPTKSRYVDDPDWSLGCERSDKDGKQRAVSRKRRGTVALQVNAECHVLLDKKDKSLNYGCKLCDAMFKDVQSLVDHNTEHGQETMTCVKCNSAVLRQDSNNHRSVCPDASFVHIRTPKKKSLVCEHCCKRFTDEAQLRKHTELHKGSLPCPGCGSLFSLEHLLVEHMRSCCPDSLKDHPGFWHCFPCDRVFLDQASFTIHQDLHSQPYPCYVCASSFATLRKMETHNCIIPDEFLNEDGSVICWICGVVDKSAAALMKHLLSHRTKTQTCCLCSEEFSVLSQLQRHIRQCPAEPEGAVRCPVCDLQCDTAGIFREHFTTHMEAFMCTTCNRVFKTRHSLTAHNCPGPEGTEQLPCVTCGQVFSSQQRLERHQMRHRKDTHVCSVCGQSFQSAAILQAHPCFAGEPDVSSQVECDTLPADGSKNTRCVCPICGNSYSSQCNLNKHILTHGEKKEECPECHKKFHLKISLKYHLAEVHSNTRKYQCGDCGKMFKARNSVRTHRAQFHSDTVLLYECEVCSKRFNQKGNLKKHMLGHSTELTYSCKRDGCDQRFKYPELLRRHELWHQHGFKYECKTCKKGYVVKNDYTKHMQAFHSGQTYVCKFCSTECRYGSTLKRHLLKRHPTECINVDMDRLLEECFQQIDDVYDTAQQITVPGVSILRQVQPSEPVELTPEAIMEETGEQRVVIQPETPQLTVQALGAGVYSSGPTAVVDEHGQLLHIIDESMMGGEVSAEGDGKVILLPMSVESHNAEPLVVSGQ